MKSFVRAGIIFLFSNSAVFATDISGVTTLDRGQNYGSLNVYGILRIVGATVRANDTYVSGGLAVAGGNIYYDGHAYFFPGFFSTGSLTLNNVSITVGSHGSLSTSSVSGSGQINVFGQGAGLGIGSSNGISITVGNGGRVNLGSYHSGLISVYPGGFLNGSPRLGSFRVLGGGRFGPGYSIGTIVVTGDSQLDPGSIYEAEVTARGDADFHHVGGVATIDGAIVDVRPYQGGIFSKSTTVPILTAEGGLVGRFGSIIDNFAFLDASLSYTSNTVNLTLTRNQNQFSSVAQTANQLAVGQALDSAEVRNEAPNLLGTFYGFSEAEARSAYSSLSGEGIADIRSAATGSVNLFLGTVRDQATGFLSGSGRNSSTVDTMRMWATMLGGNLHLSSQGNYFGSMTQVWGGAGGIEKLFDPSLRAGVALGGTSSNISVSGIQTSGQASFGHVALYGQKTFDHAYVVGAFGWSAGHTTTKRSMMLLGGVQTGAFDGQGPSGRIEAGYRFSWTDLEVAPYVALQGAWMRQNGMVEIGDPIGSLFVKGQTVTSIPGSIGVQFTKAFGLDQGWDLTLRGRTAYVHDFTPSRSITAQLNGVSQAFTATGLPLPSNALDLGLGLDILNKSGFSASLNADALIGPGAIGWKGQATIGFSW